MIPNVPPERCEAHALALSSFVDGELPFPDCLPVVDHLAGCEECRRFYLGARRLSERLVEAPTAPAAGSSWEAIERADGSEIARRRRRHPAPSRSLRAAGLAAAALLVVAIGVARFQAAPPTAGDDPAPLREIVVEGARGRMTDDRFLSLLSELLSADSRYHRETERVLRFVLRREGASALEDPTGSATEAPEPGEGDGDEAPRTARTPIPLAS